MIPCSKLDDVYERKLKPGEYSSSTIKFRYQLWDGFYNYGLLKLPASYSNSGKAVPLVVFVHGSADYLTLTSNTMTDNYEEYYNYVRDCGYAIFDCYGYGNVYEEKGGTTGSNSWGTETNIRCYIMGIKHVCERFNIDINNVFVAAKSQGGLTASGLAYQQEISIKAVGLLAPLLDIFEAHGFAYTKKWRNILAEELNLTGDWQSVLDVDDADYSASAANAYLKTQYDQFCGYNPIWRELLISPSNKLALSFDRAYDNEAFKISKTPIKIWVAMDDININPLIAEMFIETLKNAGCNAELRIMPNNTGAHHAVDSDSNALQTTDVTTRLGIHYDSVPTAYFELVEFFDRIKTI
jgi:pimeloyl-ACP methyl ester carboxylesterase